MEKLIELLKGIILVNGNNPRITVKSMTEFKKKETELLALGADWSMWNQEEKGGRKFKYGGKIFIVSESPDQQEEFLVHYN